MLRFVDELTDGHPRTGLIDYAHRAWVVGTPVD
jgi:hypothetical protein